jgi:demethylmenaquinone methyltransferase/2-methoxy-6-polyprenyl-1,4-benzoquinol methylase
MTADRRTYKWFYDHIHSRYYKLLLQWCFLPFGGETCCREALLTPVRFLPAERILDLCCGTGGATRTLTQIAGPHTQLFGLDLSSGQLRRARRQPQLRRVHFVEADARRTPFRDNVFDKVVIAHALHEMPRAMRQAVLAEARRILRDGGAVVVVEVDDPAQPAWRWLIGFWFFYWLPFNFETDTRRDMLQHGLAQEVAGAGFKSVTKESKYRGVFQTVQGFK